MSQVDQKALKMELRKMDEEQSKALKQMRIMKLKLYEKEKIKFENQKVQYKAY